MVATRKVEMFLTVAIPTFGRDQVLINTIQSLLELEVKADEILVIDQTETHEKECTCQLQGWHKDGMIRWIRVQFPSITRAMNIALREASGERILFLDDDIIPDRELISAHRRRASNSLDSIIAGRVLQPWHKGEADNEKSEFLFNSLFPREVERFMGGNVSIPRRIGIEIGGFDTNFVRVAYHFEAEFAARWRKHGYSIIYEPEALIHHLMVSRGGTRSYGKHLTTTKPDHAVGRYYFNFCTYKPITAIVKSSKELVRSILTKHHLRHPWWMPLTIIAEMRGFLWAYLLHKSGRGLMSGEDLQLLVIASHPVQYTTPIYKELNCSSRFRTHVLYLSIPDKKSQSLGFQKEFLWDVPLLSDHRYSVAESSCGKGLQSGFFGVRTRHPEAEIKKSFSYGRPDAVLLTGWHFYGMIQVFLCLIQRELPLILRMDSNCRKERSKLVLYIYRWYIRFISIGLYVGEENRKFLLSLGMKEAQLIRCPHVVDNEFFSNRAKEGRGALIRIRCELNIPVHSFCFLFVGKLQEKKRPLEIIKAYKKAYEVFGDRISLLIVGTGELEDICKEYTHTHKLPVVFAGFMNQSEIPEAYGISDCVVLASDSDETWGLVINEAMACGLPAIVSDEVGCAKDLVIEGETGYLFECGDIDKLSSLMLKLASNPVRAKLMGGRAQTLINEHFAVKDVREGIEDAMARLFGV